MSAGMPFLEATQEGQHSAHCTYTRLPSKYTSQGGASAAGARLLSGQHMVGQRSRLQTTLCHPVLLPRQEQQHHAQRTPAARQDQPGSTQHLGAGRGRDGSRAWDQHETAATLQSGRQQGRRAGRSKACTAGAWAQDGAGAGWWLHGTTHSMRPSTPCCRVQAPAAWWCTTEPLVRVCYNTSCMLTAQLSWHGRTSTLQGSLRGLTRIRTCAGLWAVAALVPLVPPPPGGPSSSSTRPRHQKPRTLRVQSSTAITRSPASSAQWCNRCSARCWHHKHFALMLCCCMAAARGSAAPAIQLWC